MATGGTIPTNRTQTVTFYNSSTVIERDKNIYYVPRFSKTGATTGQTVRQAWLNAFNSVCPPSSAYTDIEISSWSPQDRTLNVRGNIDDFRLVSEEGDCLNYFILTRTVTTVVNSVTKIETHYYAFFITGVEQAGGSSVRLSIEPDDFTNVFYLHNKTTLTSGQDYEPFNAHMKNCYVNRQHYDRVEEINVSNKRIEYTTTFKDNGTYQLQFEYIGKYFNVTIDYDSISLIYSSQSGEARAYLRPISVNPFRRSPQYNEYSGYFNANIGVDDLDTANDEEIIVTLSFNVSYTAKILSGNKIFLNQDETFKFKYQYKDLKTPYTRHGFITQEEWNRIETTDNFYSLPLDLKKKIYDSCLHYVALQTKGLELITPIGKFTTTGGVIQTTARGKYFVGNNLNNIPSANAIVYFPFILVPEEFEKYEGDITSIDINVRFSVNGITKTVTTPSIYDLSKIFATSAIGNYILSLSIVKSCFMSPTYDFANYAVYFDVSVALSSVSTDTNLELGFYGGDYLVPIACNNDYFTFLAEHDYTSWSANDFVDYGFGLSYATDTQEVTISKDNVFLGITHSGGIESNLWLELDEKDPDLINNYFDLVLENQPYSFYSISTRGNLEMVLNKERYYKGGNKSSMLVSFMQSITNGVKLVFTPYYEVEDKFMPYYNESLSYTTLDEMSYNSDSYWSYYYQNKAQMKNQFAVADKNYTFDILQHLLVSGPNAVGYRAGKGGISGGGAGAGYGALLETVNQVMEMVDESVDYWQSKVNIDMNQKAKLADMGARPDVLKQAGDDVYYDAGKWQFNNFLNHYTIDELSYNSIAKMLERVGYQVDLYDTLHVVDRVGWNFVKLNNFDYDNIKITLAQENTIKKIFFEGVTLLHDKSYLTSGHNYETILEGGD